MAPRFRAAAAHRSETRLLPAFLLLFLMLAAHGCVTHTPRPLEETGILRELRGITLAAVAPGGGPVPAAFDPRDGLDVEEAVAAALALNPGLRAFRRERGVAAGELVSAGLLQNPALELTWFHIEDFTRSLATSGWEAALSWMPPRPGERAARTSRAEARLAEVTAEIEARELELATAVRKEFARRVAAEERLAAAAASLALRGRVRDLVRGLLEGGSVTRLAANLVELEHAEALREQRRAEAELEAAARHLGRTLGLPEGAELPLQAGAGGRLPAPPLDPGSVPGDAGELVLRTPGLRAAKHRYEQAEQALRLACIRSWPWFTFGPAFERDGGAGEGTTDKLGVGLGFELPLFARGQGEIAELEARRDQLRDSYRTLLHAALGDAHDARRRLDAAGRLLLAFEQSVRPVLDENVRLTEAAFELGQVDLLQLVTTQDRVLRARMDYLLDQLAYREAWFDLEQALGAPLPRAGQGRP